jgi:hypothetical protein
MRRDDFVEHTPSPSDRMSDDAQGERRRLRNDYVERSISL